MSAEAEQVLAKLRALKPTIARRYKFKEIGLFGSLAHGSETPSSDVDLLVEFDDDADLFDLIGLELYLEEVLGRPVDIVPSRTLRPELQQTVLRQLVAV